MTKDEKYYVWVRGDCVPMWSNNGPVDSDVRAMFLADQLLERGYGESDILICRNIPFHTEVSARVVIDEEK